MSRGFDDVVVGAGSAGAVLAARLSEREDRRVLLVEAGTDGPAAPGPLGRPVLSGANWDYEAYLDEDGGDRRYPYRMGKGPGGSSAVNGAIALRGLPPDFDRWATAGLPQWDWDSVLPYYRRLEADADMKGPDHGTDGPVPVSRPSPDEYDPLALAFLDNCAAKGIPDRYDLNDGSERGAGPVPSNTLGGRRASTAEVYLAPARHRPNLVVWYCASVPRVLLSGCRATGVEVVRHGRRYEVPAGRVTLAAGAVNTPPILLRSGIGPAGSLRGYGIPVVTDLPGVGANLTDHPVLPVWSIPRPGLSRPGRPWHQVMAREAGHALFLANNVSTVDIPVVGRALGGQPAASIAAVLLRPRSRGRITLSGPDPEAPPRIALRLASDPGDREDLMRGARLAWSLTRSGALADLLPRRLMWTDRMVGEDALLRKAIGRFVTPMWHPTGTARMGPDTDPLAVLDPRGAVYGISGLRVVDASALPAIPSAPTNLTCIMLAERMAAWMS